MQTFVVAPDTHADPSAWCVIDFFLEAASKQLGCWHDCECCICLVWQQFPLRVHSKYQLFCIISAGLKKSLSLSSAPNECEKHANTPLLYAVLFAGYVESFDKFKAAGAEVIACMATNDPFVMVRSAYLMAPFSLC